MIPAFHPIISIGKDFGVHTREFAGEMKSEGTHNAIEQGSQIIKDMHGFAIINLSKSIVKI